ncbi:transporter substrate-binding domain-containing protein [Actinokineospora terrae]|uniref:Amino acid ABC transporter substrate-binding protein, PAAT family (TC 3.A.1.3.-) n=1 Tax=Actinokineospora terrae TaxID=155974 RepID=A0A1H9PYY8_9PSEU|nr:transporter substrate-binding domain-containing protein [Actinokineospora terrae]SER53360.1 amino acid ABC transporter substrate-binding protein, PAAT family (TC 3.A.1.3.-) [Actinokineospora terrae]
MPSSRRSVRLSLTAAASVVALAALSACGSSAAPPAAAVDASGNTVVTVAANTDFTTPVQLTVPRVEAIRAKLPKAVLDRGTLVIGVGGLPNSTPPLDLIGSDQKTLTGNEPDLGRLVAAVLGLTPDVQNASWQNLFVRLKSGQFDAGFSNITVTEERKVQGLDFATYRKDNLGFEVNKNTTWNFDGNYQSLAGKTVAVNTGTNQEKILIEWRNKLQAEGKTLEIRNFADTNSTYLALSSGRIDAYFYPNPTVAYHVAKTASTPNPTRSAGSYSGAGATLQGLIAATTKKDSGLVEPLAEAINYLIENGQYAKLLAAYGLDDEAIPKAEVNPPGLPINNS